MGLNITPYDEDNTAAAGTTTLRHIDQSTRLAWSTFGSVQSDPYRWGHATLPGYTPPAGRPTTPADAERVAPEPRRRRLAADDLPVGAQRRADLRPRARAGQRQHHASTARRSARRGDVRHRRRPARAPPHVFLWAASRAHPGVQLDVCACRPTRRRGLRAQRCATDRRRHPAVVARHERPRGRPTRGADRRAGVTHVRSRSTPRRTPRSRPAARRSSRSRRRRTRCRRSTLALAKATVTLTQSSSICYQVDPVTFTATVTGTTRSRARRPARCSSRSTALRSARRSRSTPRHATLVTTALPLGTHLVRARVPRRRRLRAADERPVSHLTVNLPELPS